MKLMITAIITLVAATALAGEGKKAKKTTTTTTTTHEATTAPAPGTAAAGATTGHPAVDCHDAKNKDKAECKTTH